MAEAWASACDWRHGQPSQDDERPSSFSAIGQNLYMTSAPTMNLTAGIQAWYDEKADYHLDTQTCADGAVCGHYTQVPPSATCVTRSVVARRRPGSIFRYPTQHFLTQSSPTCRNYYPTQPNPSPTLGNKKTVFS